MKTMKRYKVEVCIKSGIYNNIPMVKDNVEIYYYECLEDAKNTCLAVLDTFKKLGNYAHIYDDGKLILITNNSIDYWFEKVEEPIYETDKKYIVADTEEELEVSEREYILVAYSPNAYYPFVCVREEDEECYNKGEEYYTVSWKYAKPIPEKKYKAYLEPKFEWVLEHRKFIRKDTGEKYTIEAIGDEFILTSNNEVFNLTYLFDNFTWLDGSPFGEEI